MGLWGGFKEALGGGAHSRCAADSSLTHSWSPGGPQGRREPLTGAPGSSQGCRGPGRRERHRSAAGRRASSSARSARDSSWGDDRKEAGCEACVLGVGPGTLIGRTALCSRRLPRSPSLAWQVPSRPRPSRHPLGTVRTHGQGLGPLPHCSPGRQCPLRASSADLRPRYQQRMWSLSTSPPPSTRERGLEEDREEGEPACSEVKYSDIDPLREG